MSNFKTLLATGLLITISSIVGTTSVIAADEKPLKPVEQPAKTDVIPPSTSLDKLTPVSPVTSTVDPKPPTPVTPLAEPKPNMMPEATPVVSGTAPTTPAAPAPMGAASKPVAPATTTVADKAPSNNYYSLTLPNEYTRDLETEHAYIAELGPSAADIDAKAYTRIALDDSLLVVTLPVEKSEIGNVEYWSKIINAGQEAAFSENQMRITTKTSAAGSASNIPYQRTAYLLETHGVLVVNISYVFTQPTRVYLMQFTMPTQTTDTTEALKYSDSIVNTFKFKVNSDNPNPVVKIEKTSGDKAGVEMTGTEKSVPNMSDPNTKPAVTESAPAITPAPAPAAAPGPQKL